MLAGIASKSGMVRKVRTLSVQRGLARLVLGDLVHLVLLALLALAEGPLGLGHVDLRPGADAAVRIDSGLVNAVCCAFPSGLRCLLGLTRLKAVPGADLSCLRGTTAGPGERNRGEYESTASSVLGATLDSGGNAHGTVARRGGRAKLHVSRQTSSKTCAGTC